MKTTEKNRFDLSDCFEIPISELRETGIYKLPCKKINTKKDIPVIEKKETFRKSIVSKKENTEITVSIRSDGFIIISIYDYKKSVYSGICINRNNKENTVIETKIFDEIGI